MTGPNWGCVAPGAAGASPVRLGRPARRAQLVLSVPVGTFTVDMAASLVLGIALEMRLPQAWIQSVVATGLCGALSTRSTLAWETAGFLRTRMSLLAVAYLGVSVIIGVLLVWASTEIGRQVWG